MKKKEREIVPKRTLHLDARVTQEEYDAVKKLADECGITVSKYTRECTLGHQSKYHLTEREIEALISLTDARGMWSVSSVRSTARTRRRGSCTSRTKNSGKHGWIPSTRTLLIGTVSSTK